MWSLCRLMGIKTVITHKNGTYIGGNFNGIRGCLDSIESKEESHRTI